MPYPLEVPVFSPHSASRAVAQGAARVELNRAGSYPEGGLTPTVADLEALLVTPSSSSSGVPVRIMIRPRGPPPPSSQEGGVDFVYTAAEFDEMKASILAFRNAAGLMRVDRGDGFVFGCLRKGEKEKGEGDGEVALEVDVERNKELVQLARPFPAVFHRAFVSTCSTLCDPFSVSFLLAHSPSPNKTKPMITIPPLPPPLKIGRHTRQQRRRLLRRPSPRRPTRVWVSRPPHVGRARRGRGPRGGARAHHHRRRRKGRFAS